jgi:hypothetical protein
MQTERHDKEFSNTPKNNLSVKTIFYSVLSGTHKIGFIIFPKTVMCRQIHLNHKRFKPITLTSTCLSVMNSE